MPADKVKRPEPNSSETWEVRILGDLRVMRGGVDVNYPQTSACRLLLVYLLLHRGEQVQRSTVADAVWPQLAQDRRRVQLRGVLHGLRPEFGDLFVTSKNTVMVSPSLTLRLDASDYEKNVGGHLASEVLTQAGAKGLHAAVALYRGPLLEDLGGPWIEMERERWRLRQELLLTRLHRYEMSNDRLRVALPLALQLTELDPLSEHAHREVIRLHLYLGNEAAAREQYQRCRRIQLEVLGTEPSPETTALVAEKRTSTSPDNLETRQGHGSSGPTARLNRLPLIGREEERLHLVDSLRGFLNSSGGGFLSIEGEPGIGKTRLVDELVCDAEWHALQVLRARSEDSRSQHPFAYIVDAITMELSAFRAEELRQVTDIIWLRVLARHIPELALWLDDVEPAADIDSAQEVERSCEAFIQVLRAWSSVTPLLVVLEDLHGVDEDILRLLVKMAPRLSDARVLFVATFRGSEARARPEHWSWLTRLLEFQTHAGLRLAPLEREHSYEFFQQALAGARVPAELLQRLHSQTRGNPLHTLEVLRSLVEAVALTQRNGEWLLASGADKAVTSLAVEETIAGRLELLDGELRSVLEAASVFGHRSRIETLAELCELDVVVLLGLGRELTRRHYLEEDGQAYRFAHDKVLEMAYRGIPKQRRKQLHARAAMVLKKFEAPADELLVQHEGAENWLAAAEAALQAARSAAGKRSPHLARELAGRGLQLLDSETEAPKHTVDVQRFELLSCRLLLDQELVDGKAMASGLVELQELAERIGRTELVAEARIREANYLAQLLRRNDAVAVAKKARSIAHDCGLQHLEARALEAEGQAHFRIGDFGAAIESLKLSEELSEQTTEGRFARVEQTRIYTLALLKLGRTSEGHEQARRLSEVAHLTGSPLAQAAALDCERYVTSLADDAVANRRTCELLLKLAREHGDRSKEALVLIGLSMVFQRYESDRASQCQEQAVKLGRTLDDPTILLAGLTGTACNYTNVGRHQDALKLAHEGIDLHPDADGSWRLALLRLIVAEAYTELGIWQEAEAQFKLLADMVSDPIGDSLLKAHDYHLGRLFFLRGDEERALEKFALHFDGSGDESLDGDYFAVIPAHVAACHLKLGNLEAAQKACTVALQMTASGETTGLPHAYAHLYNSRIQRARGNHDEADLSLQTAHADLQRRMLGIQNPEHRQALTEGVAVYRDIQSDYEQRFGTSDD